MLFGPLARLTAISVAALISADALAADYIPMTSTTTGREIARAYRTGPTSLSKQDAIQDKTACIKDSREVPNSVAQKIMVLARMDREAAEIEAAKAVTACMAKKGWRIVLSDTPHDVDRGTIAAVDATLDKLAATLPRRMDELSELVRVRREKRQVIYTIKVQPKAAAEMRHFASSDPHAAVSINKSLIKQTGCEPEPNLYLKRGFTIVWEMVDAKGPISRSSLTLADCK